MNKSAANPRRRRFSRRFWLGLAALFCLLALFYWRWQPGLVVRDGRDNLNRNAIWLGHGWLGADSWFDNNAEKTRFRDARNVADLARRCRENGIRDLYPHLTPNLTPTQTAGDVAAVDDAQVERLLDQTVSLRVLPWIGGRMNQHIVPNDTVKTARFVASVGTLMRCHPRLAGVHLNVEPWKSGDVGMLRLLERLRAVLPPGKILSISGYPPQSEWYPLRLAWSEDYYRQIAARVDQIAVMLYDSSLHDAKTYQWFVARWARTILLWTRASQTEVLFGVPTYGAAGPKLGPLYHDPRVENLPNTLAGLHRALGEFPAVPPHYAGAAIYSEWETDASEWRVWQKEFHSKK